MKKDRKPKKTNTTRSHFNIFKPSAMIHASVGSFSVMGLRVIDYFIRVVRVSGDRTYYYVPISDIREICQFTGTNDELKDILTELHVTKIEYNIFYKDKKNISIWGIMSFLSEAIINYGVDRLENEDPDKLEKNYVRFSVTPSIKEQILHSKMFYFLNFEILLRLRSIYSYILYSNLVDYIDSPHGLPAMSIPDIRKIFSLDLIDDRTDLPDKDNTSDEEKKGKYSTFKILYAKVIKPAIDEINLESDIKVTAVEKIKDKYKKHTEGLRFRIARKTNEELAEIGMRASSIKEPPLIFPDYIAFILEHGHSTRSVLNSITPYTHKGEAYIITNYLYSVKKSSVNFVAYFRKALEHNYADTFHDELMLSYEMRKKLHEEKQKSEAESERLYKSFKARTPKRPNESELDYEDRLYELFDYNTELAREKS